ncbi:MAG: hypothetical protein EPN72_06195 [Nevskiaceae bacterium]|nr:MAG: hypothetical protein EPN63_03000 [Nevskiaceae bacterium]TBR73719.1 MAG: hypothetical protein EPN72_06195 [Nevskiaceae bacterium]
MNAPTATKRRTDTAAKTIVAGDRPIREINQEIREAVMQGYTINVSEPLSRHNFAVGLTGDGSVHFAGSVGYYCGGLSNGGHIEVDGNSGWGTGEGMAAGHVTINGNAGTSVGASMRGGTIHVRGNAGPRCGIAQKGGNIVVEGNVGYYTGFMAHAGRIICLGDAIDSVGDSLWEGTVWVAGNIEKLGVDAVVQKPAEKDVAEIEALLASLGVKAQKRDWKQIVAGKKLWYYEARDAKQWLMI